MKRAIGTGIVLVLLAVFPQTPWAEPSGEESTLTACRAWLSLVDKGRYSESWDQAAEFFKNAVDKKQWQKSMKAFRQPLGNMLSRERVSVKHTNTLPGAPDGAYFVIQYKTSFENKLSTVEMVTLMVEKDGTYRVSGYYIK